MEIQAGFLADISHQSMTDGVFSGHDSALNGRPLKKQRKSQIISILHFQEFCVSKLKMLELTVGGLHTE